MGCLRDPPETPGTPKGGTGFGVHMGDPPLDTRDPKGGESWLWSAYGGDPPAHQGHQRGGLALGCIWGDPLRHQGPQSGGAGFGGPLPRHWGPPKGTVLGCTGRHWRGGWLCVWGTPVGLPGPAALGARGAGLGVPGGLFMGVPDTGHPQTSTSAGSRTGGGCGAATSVASTPAAPSAAPAKRGPPAPASTGGSASPSDAAETPPPVPQ